MCVVFGGDVKATTLEACPLLSSLPSTSISPSVDITLVEGVSATLVDDGLEPVVDGGVLMVVVGSSVDWVGELELAVDEKARLVVELMVVVGSVDWVRGSLFGGVISVEWPPVAVALVGELELAVDEEARLVVVLMVVVGSSVDWLRGCLMWCGINLELAVDGEVRVARLVAFMVVTNFLVGSVDWFGGVILVEWVPAVTLVEGRLCFICKFDDGVVLLTSFTPVTFVVWMTTDVLISFYIRSLLNNV